MENYKEIVKKQKEFCNMGRTRRLSFRLNNLKKLKKEIIERYDDIVEALKKDFSKSEFETLTTEIAGTLDEISLALKSLHLWMKPEKVKTPITLFKASSMVYREPYGSVLIITAWNYPFLLAMAPLIGALAAGNCCIIKPSELSPATARIIKEIIERIYPTKYCAVIEGDAVVTTTLLEETFDFIHYTGGERVGKIVAQAAASKLTPVILELGGKSPCIVDETANIKLAARRIVWGKFVNAGQTCVAPDYILVHSSIKTIFLLELKQQIRKLYGENVKENKDYCRIINRNHFQRLVTYCSTLHHGNIVLGGGNNKEECYIEPTIIDQVKWEDEIMKEEIFGPILPVIEYETLDEVMKEIKARKKPLALYFFSTRKQRQRKVINSISFGGGCINGTLMHTANSHLPFGGVGNSGMGCYHGKWGFETFSHKKGVLQKSNQIDIGILYPPYKKKDKIIKKIYGIKGKKEK